MNTKQVVAFAIGVAVGVYVVPRIMASMAAAKLTPTVS